VYQPLLPIAKAGLLRLKHIINHKIFLFIVFINNIIQKIILLPLLKNKNI